MPEPKADNLNRKLPLRVRRPISRHAGMIGTTVVMLMLLACLGSMPYTFGPIASPNSGVVAAGGSGATASQRGAARRRFEAGDAEKSLMPPFWAPKTAQEAAHVGDLYSREGHATLPIFGTDRLGRSLFIRCLAGGAISLCVGLCAAAISVIIGTLWGTIAGWSGGRIDVLMMRIVDVLFGLPTILLIVLLAVAIDGLMSRSPNTNETSSWAGVQSWMRNHKDLVNIITLLIAIGGVSWLTMARVIRGQVLSLKQQPFMEACRAVGVPLHRQFFRHLLPNLVGPIIVYATLAVPSAILSESFLSFLGIGVKEPLPSWGNLAAAGLSELNIVRARWWLLLWPCLLIAVTLLALNFVGESLRERLDPRRRDRELRDTRH